MAYVKPPALTRRLANPLAMRLNARGVATLTLADRRTGGTRKVPVIPVEVGGSRYPVSPYGESDWVRNLRAASQGELSRKGRTEAFHAVEVPAGQRGPVIARYREAAGRVVGRVFASCLRPGIIRCAGSTAIRAGNPDHQGRGSASRRGVGHALAHQLPAGPARARTAGMTSAASPASCSRESGPDGMTLNAVKPAVVKASSCSATCPAEPETTPGSVPGWAPRRI